MADPLGEALLELDAITRRLRRDCPWDREQDERSIVPHTVEEAYELADAAYSGEDGKLRDELGDVLFQVYFLSLLLEERGQGDLASVARGTTEKLIRRHPHVFGDDPAELSSLPTEARTASEVRRNWDAIKRTETHGEPFGSIPENLPSLLYAAKLQRRASEAAAASPRDALAKIARAVGDAERSALTEEPDRDALYERIGELLFACVELARAVGVDPEVALRRAADGFRVRAGSAP
jgi:XTP/dITP diphosphohydrolase/tetrapyrrole methylase family protein/MazG family protein/ATP diphosphatase